MKNILRKGDNVIFNRPYWILTKGNTKVEVSIKEGLKAKIVRLSDCFGEMVYDLELFDHPTKNMLMVFLDQYYHE